jgi:hypothetical protein
MASFVFRGMVRNEIAKEQNSERFSIRKTDGMNQNFRLFRVPREKKFLGKWQP